LRKGQFNTSFEIKNLKTYQFLEGKLGNNFYFTQFFRKCSFLLTIIEIAKLLPKVLGHLAKQSVVPENQVVLVSYYVDCQPVAVVLLKIHMHEIL
jgi:hypothetical protein